MFSHDSEILRKLRLIEWLKAELVTNVGAVFQAMAKNGEQAVLEGLAAVVASAYVLARRIGIDFSTLDKMIITRLEQNIQLGHEAENGYGDLSELQRHLRQRR